MLSFLDEGALRSHNLNFVVNTEPSINSAVVHRSYFSKIQNSLMSYDPRLGDLPFIQFEEWASGGIPVHVISLHKGLLFSVHLCLKKFLGYAPRCALFSYTFISKI